MKTTKYMLIAAAGLLLAGCSDDEGAVNGAGNAAAVVTGSIGVESRAAGTQWAAGDAIGVTGASGDVDYTNAPYTTAAGDGSFAAMGGTANGIFFQDSKSATFSAYYPYSADVTVDNRVITADVADQRDNARFDFLYAEGATGSMTDPAIRFTGNAAFRHRMSQLVINVTATAENGFDGVTVLREGVKTLSGLKLEGTFDTATGDAVATGDAIDGYPLNDNATLAINGDTGRYTLIMFPQDAAEVVFTLTDGGTTYSCKFTPTLEAGKTYSCNIALRKAGMTVGNAQINYWGNSGWIDGDITLQLPDPYKNVGKVLMREATDTEPALYFADRNLGAYSSEEAGKYFWWGDVTGHYAGDGFEFQLNNPEILPYDVVSENYFLKPEYDAATQLLGEGWHVPTRDDWTWIVNNCSREYQAADETTGKVAGVFFRNESLDGAEIFLPIAGSGRDPITSSSYGFYSTNALRTGDYCYILMISNNTASTPQGVRSLGYNVRAVTNE